MSGITGRKGSRFEGRRFSVLRLLTSFLALGLVGATGVAATMLPVWLAQPAGAPTDQRWFAGYYDVTLESGQALARSNLNEMPGGAVLAFVVASSDTSCTPSWGIAHRLGDADEEFDVDRRVARMRDLGLKPVISFGGLANTELARACTDEAALLRAYTRVVERYDVDTIDLDIESDDLTDVDAASRRAQAIADLQDARATQGRPLDVWLTLPVMPDGLTEDGLAAIEQLLDGGVDLAGVNVMTMNYGIDLSGRTMAQASIDALQATASQLTQLWGSRALALPSGGVWSMLGATPMIGRNDVPGEIFTLDDAQTLNTFALEHGLMRLSMWSINRDRTCGTNYPNPTIVSNECSGVDQAGKTYADILAQGYDRTDPLATAGAPPAVDDPATSPYPIWSSTQFYSAGVKVVWHGGVFISKWWVQGGTEPDDPAIPVEASAWSYLGPVLAGDRPYAVPKLPEGTYPEWNADTLYQQGERVMYDGVGYEARWWSKEQLPDRSLLDRDYSPWKPLIEP